MAAILSALDYDLLPYLRFGLAITLAFSAFACFQGARFAEQALKPHFILVSGWSLVNASLMLSLATNRIFPNSLEMLNVASIVLIGSWATLVWRITRKSAQGQP